MMLGDALGPYEIAGSLGAAEADCLRRGRTRGANRLGARGLTAIGA